MTDYLSNKIRAISFFTMIMVVFWHSFNVIMEPGVKTNSLNFIVQYFISWGITRVAVPAFFLISGFLFFRNIDFSVSCYLKKYKKRFYSLLVPYISWSIIGMLILLILQSIPLANRFFVNDMISEYPLNKLFNTLFINPVPYQLWFVRDLICLVIISPLIGFFTKKSRGTWIIILLILWYTNLFSFVIFNNESLLFFTVGCFLAFFPAKIEYKFYSFTPYILSCWLLILAVNTYLFATIGYNSLVFFMHQTGIIFGIISLWFIYDYITKGRTVTHCLYSYSFSIYILHEPLLTIIKKSLFFLMGKTENSSLFIYFLAPISAIIATIYGAKILNAKIPKTYKFLTGGRRPVTKIKDIQ